MSQNPPPKSYTIPGPPRVQLFWRFWIFEFYFEFYVNFFIHEDYQFNDHYEIDYHYHDVYHDKFRFRRYANEIWTMVCSFVNFSHSFQSSHLI